MGKGIRNANKTHCRRGHPYAGDNVYLRLGKHPGRECRACKHRRKNPEAAIAGMMLRYAVRNGEVKRAPECENCKAVGRLEAHHEWTGDCDHPGEEDEDCWIHSGIVALDAAINITLDEAREKERR